MTDATFKTPVLFLIFNRPDTTRRVFDEIRKARPARLFVAADGPRKTRPEDRELCRKTRAIIEEVDWDCEVATLFRDENLGCKLAISSAIDWFFSHVEEGIILEDDCVPDQSFFPFCGQLLERYRDDERVMMIAGTNYLFNRVEIRESYYFSRYYAIWGWATWKRAWSHYDAGMIRWPEFDKSNVLQNIYKNKKIVAFFRKMMQEAFENRLNTWDIQWVYSCIVHQGLAISPKYNLISNIGTDGLHSAEPSRFHCMPVRSIDTSNLIHPPRVEANRTFDVVTFHEITHDDSFVRKCKGFLQRRVARLFQNS